MNKAPERTIVMELVSCKEFKRNFCIAKGIIRESAVEGAVGKKITCLGSLTQVVIGAYYKLTGEAIWSEQYQEHQLHFRTFEINQTASATGLQNYLAQECPHIGAGRADQIVKAYGEKALEVILTTPQKLADDIAGVNLETAKQIQAWAELESRLSSVKKRLYEAGLTTGLIKKLVDTYKEGVPDVLRENAFIIKEIHGIGFKTADRVAMKFGMPAAHPQRIKEGVLHALQEVMDDKGHTCVDHVSLINAACGLLGVGKSLIVPVIQQMLNDKELCTQRSNPAEFSRYPELFEENSDDV